MRLSICSRVTGNCSITSSMLNPASRFSKSTFTGVPVPRKTQAPLTLPGMLYTAGHWDQSSCAIANSFPFIVTVSSLANGAPPVTHFKVCIPAARPAEGLGGPCGARARRRRWWRWLWQRAAILPSLGGSEVAQAYTLEQICQLINFGQKSAARVADIRTNCRAGTTVGCSGVRHTCRIDLANACE